MKPQVKFVVSTDLIKVIDTGTEYAVHIRMSQGGWIEHEPYERTIQGLVTALQLSTEVCAGKFFPRRVLTERGDPLQISKQTLSIGDQSS